MRYQQPVLPSLLSVYLSKTPKFWHKLPGVRFGGVFRGLGIRQKISYGYAVAISIAVLGTITGLVIEKQSKAEAKAEWLRVHQQASIVKYLQDAVLQAKTHQQQLFVLVMQPNKYAVESEELLQQISHINLDLHRLSKVVEDKYFLENQYNKEADEKVKELIKKYDITVQIYSDRLMNLLQPIYDSVLSPDEIKEIQQSLMRLMTTELARDFNSFSSELAELSRTLHEQQEQEFIKYQQAENLGSLILLIGLLVSIGMAVAMATYTSWVIARPLVFTTAVAQRVTETGNFNLVAPVTTNDEVGQLANSLNQLIQRVALYTEEIKQTQAQLVQTEKMSSLGQMVAGIAHEINNPVNFISGNIPYLEGYMGELLNLVKLYQLHYPEASSEIEDKIDEMDLDFVSQDLPKILSSMKSGTERIRELVLSLRNFSRLDEAEIKKVDIHEGIDNTLLILSNRLRGAVNVKKDYSELPLIECYPAQLNQVFMNILNNAIDVLLICKGQENKQITIKTENNSSDEILVKISDNGRGIPTEIHDKIFDPFFTTKPVGQGTGLGLSISYKVIEKHQGKIEFYSAPGKGTEFTIYLPVRQKFSQVVLAA
ncbi:MAG TPA: ATP-binding protein [Leptolyngbyaceae cyanobacterium]